LVLVATALLSFFNNCARFNQQSAISSATVIDPYAVVPAPAEVSKLEMSPGQRIQQYDPQLRYTYVNADVDGNDVEDSIVFDRGRSLLTVRLFGKLPLGHAYSSVNQALCRKDTEYFAHRLDRGPQPNLDYCNSVIRPEENWGQPPLKSGTGSLQVFKGHFSFKDRDDLLILSDQQAIFARTSQGPDAIGRRPSIKQKMFFSFREIDLAQIDLCAPVARFATAYAACRENDLWGNLARPWDQVKVVDINQDGFDDLVGMVSVAEGDANSILGLWSLLSRQEGGSVIHEPYLLSTLSYPYRENKLFIGDFDTSGEPPQAIFVWPQSGRVTQLRFVCRERETSGKCARIVPKDSRFVADMRGVVGGSLPYSIDEYAVGIFSRAGAASLRMRIKSPNQVIAKEFMLTKTAPNGNFTFKPWRCPWQASTLDGVRINNGCLQNKEILNDQPLKSITRTIVISPANCGTNCAPYLQRILNEPTIRNVVLRPGVYPVQGTIYVSSLDQAGQYLQVTKRLIGLNGAVLKGQSQFHNPDGSLRPFPATSDEMAAERKQMGKCREARDYDLTDADYAMIQRIVPVEPRANWYRNYLFNMLQITGKVTRFCPMIQTEGHHITVSGFTFDMKELARVQARIGRTRTLSGLNIGYSASSHLKAEYDSSGNFIPTVAANRVYDSSRPADEDLRFMGLRFEDVPTVGLYSAANPQSPRNIVAEDLSCKPYMVMSGGYTDGDCLALNGSQNNPWPFESSYRMYVPFAPQNVENFTLRKGPHDNSYCELKGNSETFRMASVTGVLVENCKIYASNSGGPAIFLYVQDTGAKLGITFRNTQVIKSFEDDAPLRGNGSPIGAYLLAQHPYTPRRFDAYGKELLQPVEIGNDPLITIAGRSMARNMVIGKLEYIGAETFPENIAYNARVKYEHAPHIYRDTPSEVFFDSLKSSISVGKFTDLVDDKRRFHIAEVKGLTGKFVCRNCEFTGGARAFSADAFDLWGLRAACRLEIAGKDLSQLNPVDKKECKNTNPNVESGVSRPRRSLIPGSKYIIGYKADGTVVYEREPSVDLGSTHGTWFEFIDCVSSGISGTNAVVIRPGLLNTSIPAQTLPANGPLNGLIQPH
jgi:hypothetical protein